ncbi:hypothetical protein [Streptomyces sp. NPDC127105]|uniref:hypothetical protein n=1 Tax=Streptomyces sp. NPDC127105 TaxID=3345359 RepID=UPI003665644D
MRRDPGLPPTRAESQDGRELRLALDDVLDLVVRATGDQLQALGSAAQPGRRSGTDTGVVSIGSGSVHVISHPFHPHCPQPE